MITNNNYKDKLIGDIPYFREQKINEYAFRNKADISESLSKQGNIPLSSNFNNKYEPYYNRENDIRKAIEREMKPFLAEMKNELNLIVQNYREEMEQAKANESELLGIKELLEEYHKGCDISKQQNSKLIDDLKGNIITSLSQLDILKNKQSKTDLRITTLEEKINKKDETNLKILAEKVERLETECRETAKIETITNELLSTKLNEFSNEFQNLNKKQIDNSENTNKLILKTEAMERQSENIINKINISETNNNKIRKEMNSMILQIQNINNNTDTLNSNINVINEKLISYNDENQGNNRKIATIQNILKNYLEDYQKNIKDVQDLTKKIKNIDIDVQLIKDERNQFEKEYQNIYKKIAENESAITNLKQLVYEHNKINKDINAIKAVNEQLDNKLKDINDKYNELESKIDIRNKMNNIKINNDDNIHNTDVDNLPEYINFKNQQLKINNTYSDLIEGLNQEIKKIQENVDEHEQNFKTLETNLQIITAYMQKIDNIDKLLKETNNKQNMLFEKIYNINSNDDFNDFKDKLNKKIDEQNIYNKLHSDDQEVVNYNNSEISSKIKDLEQDVNALKNMCPDKYNVESRLKNLERNMYAVDDNIKLISETKIPEVYAYVDKRFLDIIEENPISSDTRKNMSNRVHEGTNNINDEIINLKDDVSDTFIGEQVQKKIEFQGKPMHDYEIPGDMLQKEEFKLDNTNQRYKSVTSSNNNLDIGTSKQIDTAKLKQNAIYDKTPAISKYNLSNNTGYTNFVNDYIPRRDNDAKIEVNLVESQNGTKTENELKLIDKKNILDRINSKDNPSSWDSGFVSNKNNEDKTENENYNDININMVSNIIKNDEPIKNYDIPADNKIKISNSFNNNNNNNDITDSWDDKF